MDQDSILVKVAANGRMSLPAKQRKLLGLENGGLVVMRVEDGDLRVRPVRAVLAELQGRVAQALGGSGTTVDEFIAERRREAARDPHS